MGLGGSGQYDTRLPSFWHVAKVNDPMLSKPFGKLMRFSSPQWLNADEPMCFTVAGMRSDDMFA